MKKEKVEKLRRLYAAGFATDKIREKAMKPGMAERWIRIMKKAGASYKQMRELLVRDIERQ